MIRDNEIDFHFYCDASIEGNLESSGKDFKGRFKNSFGSLESLKKLEKYSITEKKWLALVNGYLKVQNLSYAQFTFGPTNNHLNGFLSRRVKI